ncbi:peptidylprolyl isomerase [Paraliobacillus sediminis]|uniref:peptidylprolyl isomerase n=1 Tax=Paraliobacillus sediminis TaxID=1885916 RepID=UPI000E3ED33B|nr:peptidylprolyl isomerase [Paraliobacillus sediminis]
MTIKIKPILVLISSLLLLLILASCGSTTEPDEPQESAEQTDEQLDLSDVEENPVVTITMENDEEIILELFPDIAPNTVANFVSLIEKGFYDDLIFHRVIPDFMIQGGDPDGTGGGGPDYSIPGEFTSNGFENNLSHERGVLSMARTNEPDSAGSQFFIMVADSTNLDGEYAAFGQVIEGMEVVDSIVTVEKDPETNKPLKDQRMKTVVVDTFGYDYPDPIVE